MGNWLKAFFMGEMTIRVGLMLVSAGVTAWLKHLYDVRILFKRMELERESAHQPILTPEEVTFLYRAAMPLTKLIPTTIMKSLYQDDMYGRKWSIAPRALFPLPTPPEITISLRGMTVSSGVTLKMSPFHTRQLLARLAKQHLTKRISSNRYRFTQRGLNLGQGLVILRHAYALRSGFTVYPRGAVSLLVGSHDDGYQYYGDELRQVVHLLEEYRLIQCSDYERSKGCTVLPDGYELVSDLPEPEIGGLVADPFAASRGTR